MMNPIEELVTEHEAVQLTLQILDRIQAEIENTGSIATPDDLAQLLDFFTVFVDRCHHSKEEELLFPALEAVGVSRAGGPIGVLLDEHAQGRQYVAGMKRAFSDYLAGHREAVQTIRTQAEAYTGLLRRHIDKENQVLFPLAARHLPPAKLAELKAGFDRIEETRIGAGRHEAFHRLLERLEAAYLDSK
jgi:hemerythrin-like domain-containing protein